MSRKAQLLAAVLLLIALLVSTSAVGAQVPNDQGSQGDPPKGLLIEGVDVTKPDEKNPSSPVLSSAVALRSSLTAQQRKAIQSILKQYESAVAAATKQLPALRELTAPSTDAAALKARATEDAATFQAIQQSSLRLKTIQDKIDAKISAVLTAEQRALYQAALAPATAQEAQLSDATAQSSNAAQSVSVSPSYNPNYNGTLCSYASQYASFANIYGYLGQYYAYRSYTEAGGSYTAYYYLRYAYIYALNGQYLISSAFFDEFTLHADPFGRASGGRSYEASATNFAAVGLRAALADYRRTGSSLAYNAYYYGLLTNQRAYYAYYYSAYC